MNDLSRVVEHQRSTNGRKFMRGRILAAPMDMLENPGEAAVQSVSALAARNTVDTFILTRLGLRLGFTGFASLQDVLCRNLAAAQPFYNTRGSGTSRSQVGRQQSRHAGPTGEERVPEGACRRQRASREANDARALAVGEDEAWEHPRTAGLANIKKDDLLVAVTFRRRTHVPSCPPSKWCEPRASRCWHSPTVDICPMWSPTAVLLRKFVSHSTWPSF